MLNLEWIYILTLSLGIVATIGVCYFICRFILTQNELAKLLSTKSKSKKERRNKRQQKKALKTSKQSFLFWIIASAVGAIILLGSSFYIKYYQSMNLTKEDSEAVVASYYLIRDFEDQIKLLQDEKDDQVKLEQNIRQLSTSMASYGTKKASTLNSVNGQLILNRYYNYVKQLGMNASTQTKNFYGNSSLADEFFQDINSTKEYEDIVFKYYKVNKSVLLKNK